MECGVNVAVTIVVIIVGCNCWNWVFVGIRCSFIIVEYRRSFAVVKIWCALVGVSLCLQIAVDLVEQIREMFDLWSEPWKRKTLIFREFLMTRVLALTCQNILTVCDLTCWEGCWLSLKTFEFWRKHWLLSTNRICWLPRVMQPPRSKLCDHWCSTFLVTDFWEYWSWRKT